MVPHNDNTQQKNFILFYIPFSKSDNPEYDPRSKYLSDAKNFPEFLQKIQQVMFNKDCKTYGTIRLNIEATSMTKKEIYFGIGKTQTEANKEIQKTFKDALKTTSTSVNKHCYIEIQGDLNDILTNYSMNHPQSLFALAINMYHGDYVVSLPSAQKTKTFVQWKQEIIAILKQAETPKTSLFQSMSNFFLCCYGHSHSNEQEQQDLNGTQQFLEENLYAKIEQAQDLPSLSTLLVNFRDESSNQSSRVKAVQERIPIILGRHEFDITRTSTSSTMQRASLS